MTISPVAFANPGIDRAATLRADDAQLAALLADPGAYVLPVLGDGHPVDDGFAPVRLSPSTARDQYSPDVPLIFLGLDPRPHGGPVFAADAGDNVPEETQAPASLHKLAAALTEIDAHLLAYARALIFWHREHRHCSRCGSLTEITHGGHQRRCLNNACRRVSFPRTDAAAIMAVSCPENEHLLLGRQSVWPAGMMSVLAGFLEPGESLEDCVRREVAEETDIVVDGVRYMGSQPWPFPASLMIGFIARATTTEITIDPEELESARWVSRDALRSARTIGAQDPGPEEILLPPPVSISRQLINYWLDEL